MRHIAPVSPFCLLVLLGCRMESKVSELTTDPVEVDSGSPEIDENQLPICSFDSPTDGTLVPIGQSITLTGHITDADHDANILDITWESSLEGVLASGHPEGDGTTSWVGTLLTSGEHRLILRATDPEGGTCEAAKTLVLDAPPTITITNPPEGFVLDQGEELALAAMAADPDEPLDQLQIVWESDLGGTLCSGNAGSDGLTTCSPSSLPVGLHTIRVQVTDTWGLSAEDHVWVQVNGTPTEPEVTLEPDPATTDDALTAVLSVPSTDPDGDPITYTYEWYRDGVLSGASTSEILPAEATTRGEAWRVIVTPFDGRIEGPAAEDTITIGNTAPTLTDLSLSPDPAYTDDLLVVAALATDADADPVTFDYQWSVNGTPLATSGPTRDGSHFSKGDVVEVLVTPQDGLSSGAPGTTSRTISNSAPTMPVVTIDPSDPMATADDLFCDVVSPSTDLDGDPIQYSMTWTVDGVATTADTSVWPEDLVAGSFTSAGETWTCTTTAHDGTDVSPAAQDSVTIGELARSLHCSGTTSSLTDRLVVNYTSGLPSGAQPRTLEAWVRTTAGGERYVVTMGTFNWSQGYYLGLLNGHPVVTQIGSHFNSPTSIADGTWHHIAVVYQGSVAGSDNLLYVDGTLVAGGDLGINTGSTQLTVCSTLNGETKPFLGDVDEVRIWNYARTQAEIQADQSRELTGLEPGLLVYYDMNEVVNGAGGTMPNRALATGALFDALIEGTSTTPTSNPDGAF